MEPISFENRPSGNLQGSKIPKEHQSGKGQEKVEAVAQSEMGFFGRLAGKAKQKIFKAKITGGLLLYRKELAKQEDEARAFLDKHVIGINQIDHKLPQELDGIIQFLRQVGVPISENEIGADPQSNRKQLITSLVWIIVGNLSRQVIAENEAPISTADLADRAVRHLMHFFGERINQLEAQYGIGKIPGVEFLPISNDLLAQILPIKGFFIDKIKPKAYIGLAAAYEAIQKLIAGESSTVDLTPIKPLIKSVDRFILNSVVENSLKRDESNLTKLTGQSDQELSQGMDKLVKELEQHLSKPLTEKLKDYLPNDPNLMRKTIKAVLTKLCLHAAQNLDHQNPDHPHSVEGLLGVLKGKLQEAYADPNAEAATNLSKELFALILPPDVPYIGELAKRYDHHFLPLVTDTISTLFTHLKAQPQSIIDARERIAAKVKKPDTLMALIDMWNEKALSMVPGLVQKNVESNPLVSVGLKVLGAFDEQAKVALKAATLKMVAQLIPDPAPGTQWDSSEVFAKVLDRLNDFAHEKLRPVTDALKEVSDERERLDRAKELSLPLMKDFIRTFVSVDLLSEIPLLEKYRTIVLEKIEQSLNDLIAAELVKATQRAIEHPEEPELADAIFTIQQQSVTAKVRMQEAKNSLIQKIDGFGSLTQLLDEQAEEVSKKATASLITSVTSNSLSEEQLGWLIDTSQPLEIIVKSWFWKIFEKMIPQPAEGKKLSLEEVIPTILECFEKFADDQFPGFLQEAKKGDLNEERLQQLSKPILQAFIKRFISEDLAGEIPLPCIYQKKVAGIIEDLLAKSMSGTMLRYAHHAKDVEKGQIPVISKYKALLPLDLQNSLNPLFEIGGTSAKVIDRAKTNFRNKVENPESIISVVDQVSGKASDFVHEKIFQMISEKFFTVRGARVLKPLKPLLRGFIEGWFWKVFVQMIPIPKDGKKIKAEEILPRILENFVQFSKVHFPELMVIVKRDWKGLSTEERKKQALQLNKPILKAFMKQFISDDLAAEIPLPEKYRNTVVEKIESTINELVSDALVASCGWILEKQENEESLNRMFKSKDNRPNHPSAPVKACHAAGKILQAVLPYQCREKGNEWAKSIFDKLKTALPEGEASKQIASVGMKMVSSLFAYIGHAQSSEVKSVLSFLGNYVETALLKLSRQLGERVERLDNALVEGDLSTMEKILGILISELEPHMRVYSENKKIFQENDQEITLNEFRRKGLLHPGMGDRNDRDIVFKSWSAKILALAGLNAGSPIPVPAFFRSEAWKQLQDTLLPSLLLTVFDKLKDPHLIDQVILIGLQKFSVDSRKKKNYLKSMRDMFFPKAQPTKVREFDDSYQVDLEEKLGQLGRLILRLHSSPLVGLIMRSRRVRKKLGEAVGQNLRKNLRQPSIDPAKPGQAVSLNQVLGVSLEAFVDHFVPCERVGDQWNYFALDEQGNITDKKLVEPDLSQLFPASQEERNQIHQREVLQRSVHQREVMKAARHVIREKLNLWLQSFGSGFWDSIANGFVRMMRAIARSKHKDKVEVTVRKVFAWLRRNVLFPILALVTIALWLPAREIGNAILEKKGKKHIQGLKHNIHANLAYRFVDELLHKLEGDVRRKEAQAKKVR